jgi:hypothetical protein
MSEARDLDFERFKALLELSKRTFKCLRSGECCIGFEVLAVPGYNRNGEWTGNLAERGRKPAMQACQHLERARVVDGVWQQAACKIHDDPGLFPDECSQFTLGIGDCSLGRAIWQHRKKTDPEAKLPADAERSLASPPRGPEVTLL